MKRVWQHPEEPKTGRRYWRSLGEHAKTPEFNAKVGREFDPGLATLSDEERETSRRDFVKMMGGAAALAGLTLTSCRRPLAKIMPFTKHVEWVIPGKPLLYATAMPRPWGASPMVVVSHEGRPTHLQGNPLHPSSAGLDVFAQASVLDLYNPERAKMPALKGRERAWHIFQHDADEWTAAWKSDGGAGVALLLNPGSSVTRAGLLADFTKAYPKAKIFEYEPVHRRGYDAAVKALFGAGVRLLPKFAKADIVFSFDCDFTGLDTISETATRDFMKRRSPGKKSDAMNRLYVLENRYTLTGGVSDHRMPLPASLIPVAAAVLAEKVGVLAGDPALQQAAAALAAGATAKLRDWLTPAAEDLFASKGKALVLAGPRYGEAVHALVLGINQALGAFGATIDTLKVESRYAAGGLAQLKADLNAKKIAHLLVLAETDPAYDGAGVLDGIKKQETGDRLKLTHLTDRPKATTKYSQWALPMAHYLESWDDVRCADGSYSVVQPMIQPLFNGISVNEILLVLLGRKKFAAPPKPVDPKAPAAAAAAAAPAVAPSAAPAPPAAAVAPGTPAPPSAPAAAATAPPPPAALETDAAYEAVKATFARIAGGANEEKWNNTLRDGFLPGTTHPKAAATCNSGAIAAITAKARKPVAPAEGSYEIVLTPDASLYDGRHTDNPWLQEAPDPVTKLTWDNAAWISPRTFANLGLKKDGDLIEIKVGGKSLTIPAIAAPGHATDSVTIPLGYGQKSFSMVGDRRGFDAYPLAAGGNFILAGASVKKAGGHHELAITQDNYTMEGRAQVREATQQRFKDNEHFAAHEGLDSHAPPVISLYQGRVGSNDPQRTDYNAEGNGFDYQNEHQWGMVIDLGKCIGCSACVVACQSENNIPIVGKDQVARGRVLHWIRMDRYFATPDGVDSNPRPEDLENPEMVHQPVACQQCESAPCETVCPVNATVHTEDGLNAMAYNRCIGTRYCANNCPYTARRFNWFDYNKRNPLIDGNLLKGPLGEKNLNETVRLQKNPNVTVRMRGVIEKCTYCVQRIESAKIDQRRIARDDAGKLRIPADAVKTACQASCPAEAIMFGDLANPKSTLNKWKENPRNYEVLKYIGTRPRTSYLARIRNVNPKMPDDRTVKTGEASLHGV